MSNWQNEVFSDETQYLTDDDAKNGIIGGTTKRIIEKVSETKREFKLGCKVCGTLTGIHSFSFDSKD